MSDITLLSISGISIPDDAARGITVTLQPEDNGSLERDVEGTLQDLTVSGFQKYKISISCSDTEAPLLSGIFRGSGPFDLTLVQNTGLPDQTDGTPFTLSVMVDTWQTSPHEWDAVTDWQIDLVEV
jgi:hypothetical protein